MSNSSFIESVAIEQLNDKAFYIIFRPKEGEEVSSVESVDNQSFEDGYRFFVLNGVFEEEITIFCKNKGFKLEILNFTKKLTKSINDFKTIEEYFVYFHSKNNKNIKKR